MNKQRTDRLTDEELDDLICELEAAGFYRRQLIGLVELQERRKAQDGFMMPDRIKNVDLRSPLEVEDMYRDRMKAICRAGGANLQRVLELENALEDANAELQERRKADSAEPVSFDALNAAVAEVTGSNKHSWNAAIYKGHHPVPFMNYNSLARIVDKYRVPQPVPIVPEECPEGVRDLMASHSDALFNDDDAQEIWNACRVAMFNQAPVKQPASKCPKCGGRGSYHCPQMLGTVECECTASALKDVN